MRSDRDKRTDTEREIDEFLSKFESPADELSADIDSYLDDNSPEDAYVQKTAKVNAVQTFTWKNVDPAENTVVQNISKTGTATPSVKNSSDSVEKPEKAEIRKQTAA